MATAWIPKIHKGNTFKAISEVAAAELSKSNGSLTNVPDGRLVRVSVSANDWDMEAPWHGRALTSWSSRKSLWVRGIVISFYVEMNTISVKLPTFTLTLSDGTTPEEVTTAAETYMMLLNLRRKD